MNHRAIGCWGSALLLAAVATSGRAQVPAGYTQLQSQTVSPAVAAAPGSYERLTGRNNPALSYFGGSHVNHFQPRRPKTYQEASRPVATSPLAKPYSNLVQGSNVTPYLALDVASGSGISNYYAFVRPQMDQFQMNQVQQAEYRRLQQQVRVASAGSTLVPGTNGGMPTTGHSTQFLNPSGYYPNPR